MNTISIEEINTILNKLRQSGEKIGDTRKLSHNISMEKYKEDGWMYTIFFEHSEPVKIEAFNHRELIEKWVR